MTACARRFDVPQFGNHIWLIGAYGNRNCYDIMKRHLAFSKWLARNAVIRCIRRRTQLGQDLVVNLIHGLTLFVILIVRIARPLTESIASPVKCFAQRKSLSETRETLKACVCSAQTFRFPAPFLPN